MNAGHLDRTVRIVLGTALLSLTVFGPHTMLGLIGVVPLVTGVMGFCPLYKLVGLNTCPVKK
jgi:hypothetical protein